MKLLEIGFGHLGFFGNMGSSRWSPLYRDPYKEDPAICGSKLGRIPHFLKLHYVAVTSGGTGPTRFVQPFKCTSHVD